MEPFEIITESTAITLYYGYTKFKNIFEEVRLIKILKNMLFLLMQDIQKLLLF